MNDIVLRLAGVEPGTPFAEVAGKRADIFELTGKTHDAALRPVEPGGLSHGLRAAIACRIARLNGDEAFAEHFRGLLNEAGASDEERRAADLAFMGDNARTKALIRHADLVAANPKAATKEDVGLLKQAGVSESDIVRLAELVAFVSYQIRVAAGLRLMRQAR